MVTEVILRLVGFGRQTVKEHQRIIWTTIGILLVLGAAAYFWLKPAPIDATGPEPSASQTTVAEAAPTLARSGELPPDRYPLPATAQDGPLPALAESDPPFAAALGALTDPTQLTTLLVSEQLIQRLVVTVDNLPREPLSVRDRAFKRLPGEFVVRSRDGSYSTSPANEARYAGGVALLQAVGAEAFAKLYLRFYPLFNQAYRELGKPDREFNDRLIQVIDHLLATPSLEEPIALIQPKVLYQFADPALEARSTGQKMLIRMGATNRAQVKIWLAQFRAAIIGRTTP